MKLVIIAAFFHKETAEEMVMVARRSAKDAGWDVDSVVKVPGAYEIPLLAQHVLNTNRPDAVVVLGFIERGETLHGEVMGHVVHRALVDLQLQYKTPIGIGIIGPGATEEQVQARKKHAAVGATRAAIATYALLHSA